MTKDLSELGYFDSGYKSALISTHPYQGRIYSGPNPEPLVTFRPDGTVDVRGDTYESAKVFWDYVRQFAAAEYAKHAPTHHEIRDLGELVAERKGKE